MRKALVLRASPYTNPFHVREGGKRAHKSDTAMSSRGACTRVKFRRKFRIHKDMLHMDVTPVVAPTVMQMDKTEVSVLCG